MPDHIVYLVRPLIPHVKTVALQIQGCISTGKYIICNIIKLYIILCIYFIIYTISFLTYYLLLLFQGIRTQYHVFFVPHRSVVCEQILEDEGLLKVTNIGEFHLGLVPLDSDILSLEMSESFRQVFHNMLHHYYSMY